MKMLSLDDAIKAVTMLLDNPDDIDKIWSCDVINNLKHAPSVEEIESAQKWISVKDGLPKEMQDVLLKFPSNMAVGYYVEGGWMVYSGGDWTTDICEDDEVPQYWMPLPEAPKEVDDERSNGNA